MGQQAEAANASGNAFSVEYERGACLGGTPGCSCGQMGKGGWSKQVAEEGITLLANRAARLPLRGLGASIKKIAVIGPNADNVHSTLGIYGQEPGDPGTVTVLQAVVSPTADSTLALACRL